MQPLLVESRARSNGAGAHVDGSSAFGEILRDRSPYARISAGDDIRPIAAINLPVSRMRYAGAAALRNFFT